MVLEKTRKGRENVRGRERLRRLGGLVESQKNVLEKDDFLSLLPLSPSLSILFMEVVELNQVRGEPE